MEPFVGFFIFTVFMTGMGCLSGILLRHANGNRKCWAILPLLGFILSILLFFLADLPSWESLDSVRVWLNPILSIITSWKSAPSSTSVWIVVLIIAVICIVLGASMKSGRDVWNYAGMVMTLFVIEFVGVILTVNYYPATILIIIGLVLLPRYSRHDWYPLVFIIGGIVSATYVFYTSAVLSFPHITIIGLFSGIGFLGLAQPPSEDACKQDLYGDACKTYCRSNPKIWYCRYAIKGNPSNQIYDTSRKRDSILDSMPRMMSPVVGHTELPNMPAPISTLSVPPHQIAFENNQSLDDLEVAIDD